MALRLVVKSVTDLPKLDWFNKIDPYCDLTFHEEKQSTRVISNNQSPEWNESFKWTLEVVPEATESIEVLVFDHEAPGKNRLMCKGNVPLASAMEQGSASLDIAVVNPEGETLDGKLYVDLSYRAPVSESLKGDVGTLKERVEELEGQVKNLQVTITQTTTENANAKAKIEQLQAELSAVSSGEDLRTQNENLTREITALKRRIEQSQPAGIAQPASGESGEREKQPLIRQTEETQGCCTLL